MINVSDMDFTQNPNLENTNNINKEIEFELIPEDGLEDIEKEYCPFCNFSKLIENEAVLYKIAKSSQDIANIATEQHPYIPCNPNSFMKDTLNKHGLSLTGKAPINCLEYGDLFAKITFPKENISKDLYNEKLYRKGTHLDEYIARCVWVSEVKPIADPDTLKEIINVSSDAAFFKALCSYGIESWSPDAALKKFGLYDSYKYWQNIRNEWVKMEGYRISDANTLRGKLDEILEQTLKEIKKEKHLFEHNNDENNQKYNSGIEL